ncbi:uncharacterized protein LOC124438806 isoform X1 [Xenia sp. Carnegie-2017]|nr:uncharacterized protein LOC124438806 isoform X1 [Xenia sp. Carnegie-2017]
MDSLRSLWKMLKLCMSRKRIIQCIHICVCIFFFVLPGISLFAKFCVECKIPYRYQEYSAGVHNFNDNWLLSLGICDMIRKHLQVHNAVSRTVEAIENWLQLRPFQLPRGQMMNAYLHFEALSDHDYGFSCVLCGHFPPLLTLDVDKKGIFELAVSELQLPDPESDAPADEVDAEKYWQQVNCGILYRGVLRGTCYKRNGQKFKCERQGVET